MTAYIYPLAGTMWTMMFFFIWVMWIMLLFRVFADIFRSRDISGLGKVGWLILVIAAPFLGVFIYMIVRGKHQNEALAAEAQARQQAYTNYSPTPEPAAASATSTAAELTKLASLKDQGILTDAEFAQEKAKILA